MTGDRVAILVVDGFDRRQRWGHYEAQEALQYPWVDLCLRQIARHSQGANYEILIYDNTRMNTHLEIMRAHERVRLFPGPLMRTAGRLCDRLAPQVAVRLFDRRHFQALDDLVAKTGSDVEYIITLDTDSFPIRDGWIETLTGHLKAGAAITGVYRDEMQPRIRPFIHVSCLCIRRDDLLALDVSFSRRRGQDTGQNITEALLARGRRIAPIPRSNARNFHFVIGGIYGDLVYHHGAGSRRGKFWTSDDIDEDERVRVTLRDAAFRDLDHLIAVLRGERDDDFGLRSHPETASRRPQLHAAER